MTLQQFLLVFIWAMVPIVELRGAIPIGLAHGLDEIPTYIIAVLGNMVPVPFIIWFIRPVFHFLETKTPLKKFVQHFQNKAETKAEEIKKYEMLGLFLFVAVPLPGTGAWTGALIASALNMRLKHAFPAILLGVITAGLIMLVLSKFGIMLFQS